MDRLKPLNEVTEPDPRNKNFVVFEGNGQYRPCTIEDHYERIAKITLSGNVPEDVQEHFEVARNLLLYSWYVYRFIPVAEMHALTSLEFALKRKLKIEQGPGLSSLIDQAISNGWVSKEGFSNYQHRLNVRRHQQDLNRKLDIQSEIPEPPDYLQVLKKSIPLIRNTYAHGSRMLHPGGYGQLEICAEFINQIFDNESLK